MVSMETENGERILSTFNKFLFGISVQKQSEQLIRGILEEEKVWREKIGVLSGQKSKELFWIILEIIKPISITFLPDVFITVHDQLNSQGQV